MFPIAYHLCLEPTNTLELRLALIQFISKAFSMLFTPNKTVSLYVATHSTVLIKAVQRFLIEQRVGTDKLYDKQHYITITRVINGLRAVASPVRTSSVQT